MFDILKILKINLADIFAVEEEDITPATAFEELGADIIDMQEIMLIAEEEFGVLIDDDNLKKFVTVGDLIAYIEGHRND